MLTLELETKQGVFFHKLLFYGDGTPMQGLTRNPPDQSSSSTVQIKIKVHSLNYCLWNPVPIGYGMSFPVARPFSYVFSYFLSMKGCLACFFLLFLSFSLSLSLSLSFFLLLSLCICYSFNKNSKLDRCVQ